MCLFWTGSFGNQSQRPLGIGRLHEGPYCIKCIPPVVTDPLDFVLLLCRILSILWWPRLVRPTHSSSVASNQIQKRQVWLPGKCVHVTQAPRSTQLHKCLPHASVRVQTKDKSCSTSPSLFSSSCSMVRKIHLPPSNQMKDRMLRVWYSHSHLFLCLWSLKMSQACAELG